MPRKTAWDTTQGATAQRFNEAGAECPGKRWLRDRGDRGNHASMRPGRNAPENRSLLAELRLRCYCFNEAGAECPGKPSSKYGNAARPLWLQ